MTLIELLIVITIMMGVLGLVGGSTLSAVDRAKAQTEFISVHSLIKKTAVRSFSTGVGLSLHFESDEVSVFNGSELHSQINFEHLEFEDQSARVLEVRDPCVEVLAGALESGSLYIEAHWAF